VLPGIIQPLAKMYNSGRKLLPKDDEQLNCAMMTGKPIKAVTVPCPACALIRKEVQSGVPAE
jgi:hypothetical protein